MSEARPDTPASSTQAGDDSAVQNQEQAYFRILAENVGAVFWLTDWVKREVLYVSPKWEHIWGQSVECLFGGDHSAWADNIHLDDRARVLRNFGRDVEQGTYDEDFRVVHPDGSVRWLQERAFPIRDEHGDVVRVAGVAEDITSRKQAEEELQRARDEIDDLRRAQIASLTSELLFAEENERHRISNELHDGLNQLMTLALLRTAQLKDATRGASHELATEIERILNDAGRSARSLTYQLSPPILYDLGFEPAIQWLAEDVQRTYGLEVELDDDGEAAPLDDRVRILLFRALRELLINIAKHAGAKRAHITFQRSAERLTISVRDDGKTFDPNTDAPRGSGLDAIRERLANLGGRMRIQSDPRTGTEILLETPLALRLDGAHVPDPFTP